MGANPNSFLKYRREQLGLTMKDVAKKVGVSEGTISRWESGIIQNMRRDKIAKLAKVLQIEPSMIMGWDEPKQKSGAAEYGQPLADDIVLKESNRKYISQLPAEFKHYKELLKKYEGHPFYKKVKDQNVDPALIELVDEASEATPDQVNRTTQYLKYLKWEDSNKDTPKVSKKKE